MGLAACFKALCYIDPKCRFVKPEAQSASVCCYSICMHRWRGFANSTVTVIPSIWVDVLGSIVGYVLDNTEEGYPDRHQWEHWVLK